MVIFMGITKNYFSESDTFAFALQSKERLLPKEALSEGSDEANFDEEAHYSFRSATPSSKVSQNRTSLNSYRISQNTIASACHTLKRSENRNLADGDLVVLHKVEASFLLDVHYCEMTRLARHNSNYYHPWL